MRRTHLNLTFKIYTKMDAVPLSMLLATAKVAC